MGSALAEPIFCCIISVISSNRCIMFDDPNCELFDYKDIPKFEDCCLMDEEYLEEYEKMLIDSFYSGDWKPVGYISWISVINVEDNYFEISWFPTYARYHEISIKIPKEQFILCVSSRNYDVKPRIFLKNGCIDDLHIRCYSVFCLIDAVGVKEALNNNIITSDKLINIRNEIDLVASKYKDISFISWADSILLKSNWTVGLVDTDIKYTYKPEIFFKIILEIKDIFKRLLGLNIYAVLTQGSNEFYEDNLLHISKTNNHICFNCLGLPFSQLFSIESAAKTAKLKSEIYMDQSFYNSLKFNIEFERESTKKSAYKDKMSNNELQFYYSSCQYLIDNLRHKI